MTQLPRLPWFLCVLAACSPETASVPEPPKLVAQRVTATVKREAVRLVHLRTEHEAFVTTPEHPFATPEAGWIPAGRLVPGDQVVSARSGTLRVLSVQNERAVQSRAVFNLTVASSHAYVVGASQVLVHNRKCKDPAERDREIEAAERELEALMLNLVVAVAEDKLRLQQRVNQLKRQVAKLKAARARRKRTDAQRQQAAGAEPAPSAPEPVVALGPEASRSDAIGRTARALERLKREIEALEGTGAGSSQHFAELKSKHQKLSRYLAVYRIRDKQRRGIARLSPRQRALRKAEADYESRTRALEAAQAELSAQLRERPRSAAERKARAERRAALKQEIETLRFDRAESKAILDEERRIAELAARSPSTDAERQQIEAEQRALRGTLSKMRSARRWREHYRKKRADPQSSGELLRRRRHWARQALRTAKYEADTGRPRDTLELLEAELAERRQEAGSEHQDERIEYLTEHIATLKALAQVRRSGKRINDTLRSARAKREELRTAGRDTQDIHQKIVRLERDWTASRVRRFQLRLREAVLKLIHGTTQMDGLDARDEARLREFERELEGELAAGGHLGEQRLREIQQELESELIDAEFLESIWREAEAEDRASQELQETVHAEAEEVDTLLMALSEPWGKGPSPQPAAAPETGLQALQRELQEERHAAEGADFALANEHAFLSQTLGRPGSSQHATGAQRLAELQEQRLQLRIDWRARVQARLDAARHELQTSQSREPARDEALEAELARRIALLEHEVNNPIF